MKKRIKGKNIIGTPLLIPVNALKQNELFKLKIPCNYIKILRLIREVERECIKVSSECFEEVLLKVIRQWERDIVSPYQKKEISRLIPFLEKNGVLPRFLLLL